MSKIFIYISLFIGVVSMLFIGQEKQYGIFAWIAPIFLLQFSRRAKPMHLLYLFLLLIIAGYITQKTHNLFNNPVFGIINGIAYAFIHIIIYSVDRLLFVKGKKILSTLLFPTVYVVVEAVTTSLLGTSGVLAQSQFSFYQFAQLSTITGMHGITFIICWFASIIYWLFENEFKPPFIQKGIFSFVAVFTIVLSFGFIRVVAQSETNKEVKVATVSGSFNLNELVQKEEEAVLQLANKPDMKIPASFFSGDTDISIQLNNTVKAAESGAKIIIWNEAALFLNQNQLCTLLTEIKKISKTFGTYILIAFFEENNTVRAKPINNKSILITKEGTIGWEYKKLHPTPAEIPLVNSGDSEIPTLNTEYGIVSNVICYDYDFPSLSEQANEKKVDIMLVPSYDWEGFASMHSKMAQFETLQNGRLLIRSNGNGINMVTDNNGRVIAELNTFTSKDRVLYANLPLNSSATFYAKTDRVFVIISFIYFAMLVLFRITLRKSNLCI